MKRILTIILSVIISITIITFILFGQYKLYNAKTYNSFVELGIKYLIETNYEEAIIEFSKAIDIDQRDKKARELLELVETYLDIENKFLSRDYILTNDLIIKINKNQYIDYIKDRVDEIGIKTTEKITIMSKIDSLDSTIRELINQNKFQEALDLIKKYSNEDLDKEYLDKLNELVSDIDLERKDYENRIAKEDELKRQEEKLKRQEEEIQRQKEELRRLENEKNSFAYVEYYNGRYGYSISYPDFLTEGPAPANNDGRVFSNSNYSVELVVYGRNNVFNETTEELFNEDIEYYKNNSSDITYTWLRDSDYIISGYGGNTIFYKYMCGGKGSFNSFYITYPISQKDKYDDIIQVMYDRFTTGDLSISH